MDKLNFILTSKKPIQKKTNLKMRKLFEIALLNLTI